jgi:hypothetical protein
MLSKQSARSKECDVMQYGKSSRNFRGYLLTPSSGLKSKLRKYQAANITEIGFAFGFHGNEIMI